MNSMVPYRSPVDELVATVLDPIPALPSLFGRSDRSWRSQSWPEVDLAETDSALIVSAALPGIDPDKVDIELLGNTLTIRGGGSDERIERDGERVIYRERRSGRFARSFTLPVRVDSDAVKASYEHGMLRIEMPKAAEAKARRIAIGVNDSGIEGSDTGSSKS